MARQDRGEEKKRRRKKRLEKRQKRDVLLAPLDPVLSSLQRHLSVPQPARWPGGCDPSLARPDLVKLDLAEFAMKKPPGKEKAQQLEDGLRKGLLGFLPNVDHWGWEEFVWHGLPGDTWHTIDAFLEQEGSRFPPPAAEQLRRWKEARLGLFEIGEVADDTVALRDWDVVSGQAAGPWFRAITLNIGGVNLFAGEPGKIELTYVAPWLPAENLYCGLGYGMSVPPDESGLLAAYLGLQHPELASQPLPWKVSRAAEADYLRQWRSREWYGWLEERLQVPFWALVTTPPRGMPQVKEVSGMLPSTAEQASQFGIYFRVRLKRGEMLATGATHVTPLEITSPNRMALAEYLSYRDKVGPPPATRGQPTFMELG
jgi:hypothetical protein